MYIYIYVYIYIYTSLYIYRDTYNLCSYSYHYIYITPASYYPPPKRTPIWPRAHIMLAMSWARSSGASLVVFTLIASTSVELTSTCEDWDNRLQALITMERDDRLRALITLIHRQQVTSIYSLHRETTGDLDRLHQRAAHLHRMGKEFQL